uniref:Matrix Gla protein n=1 Tax=Catharus ustulatus TaxID=91951 RepID=A0A8C3XXF3_CATUS
MKRERVKRRLHMFWHKVIPLSCIEYNENWKTKFENSDPFLNRRRANDFIQADSRLRAIAQERIRERSKAPYEHQRELCEDYYPCEMYAHRHGYPAAYKHYFGGRRRTK